VAQRLQMRLQLDFPRYLRRICQGISLSDPQTSTGHQIGAAFCLPAQSTVEAPMSSTGIEKE